MTRQAIPDAVQQNILTKSRRRCCLCFWLEGIDEVKKGQLAHLDHDHSNSVEENLAFLCLDHHDEYDGKTSVSKPLKEREVRHWRDELYREMEYRFRTIKKVGFELRAVGVVWRNCNRVGVRFRLKNSGETSVRRPIVSIRLPDNVGGELPKVPRQENPRDWRFGLMISEPPDLFDPWAMKEDREDLFEDGGRVGVVQAVGGINPVLMSGHSTEFDGLSIPLDIFPPGAEMNFEYRVDGEESPPVYGSVTVVFPTETSELIINLR